MIYYGILSAEDKGADMPDYITGEGQTPQAAIAAALQAAGYRAEPVRQNTLEAEAWTPDGRSVIYLCLEP